MDGIESYLNQYPPISNMMEKNQIYGVIYHLEEILKNNIEGDVVELGCNVGTTSIYIRRWLDMYRSSKTFHVYDSWLGLPAKLPQDAALGPRQFLAGACRTSKESFIHQFRTRGLAVPEIHSGWFKNIPDGEYPDEICFAFLDGDFYSSIMDSLNKVYHKMTTGGIIIIDDCGWAALPGCKRAVEDFLDDKEETLELTGYPDQKYVFGEEHCGGRIVKLGSSRGDPIAGMSL
jgi:O-methyltransferase